MTTSAKPLKPKKQSAHEKANAKIDLRGELARLETMLNELKVQYEQHFLGVRQLAPDQLHRDVRLLLRKLVKAPFKTSVINFQLRTIEGRYHTFQSYWTRVNKQREEGTYQRDVFKAELREKAVAEDARAQTNVGAAEKHMRNLFDSYRSALEKTTGKKQEIDFTKFQDSLLTRAKDLKEKMGVKKVRFKVTVKDGKVKVQATGKKEES
jgi:hypothetical protein